MKITFVFVLFLTASRILAAEPLQFERLGDKNAAAVLAWELTKKAPYPDVTVRETSGTNSMWPTFDRGCYLVWVRKPWAEVLKGEVASFSRKAKGFVTEAHVSHRIVDEFVSRKGVRTVILQGDNNSFRDAGTFGEEHYGWSLFAVVRFESVPWYESMTRAQWDAKTKRESLMASACP